MSRSPKRIAELMAVQSPEQVCQIAYRAVLVDAWKIKPGERVLEVGCGQGDTTAVLADRVGPKGKVLALDSGSSDYGAPISLGEATNHLAAGPLGEQIVFRLGFRDWESVPSGFDAAAFVHCAWYFASFEELVETLRVARTKACRLHFVEWSIAPMFPEQIPHCLAATVQGLASAFQPDTKRNIRLALPDEELVRAIEAAGWEIANQARIHRPQVADGQWEVQMALDLAGEELSAIPEPVQQWIHRTISTLRGYPEPYATLPSNVIWAE